VESIIKNLNNNLCFILSKNEKLSLYSLNYITDSILKRRIKKIILIGVENQVEKYFQVLLPSDTICLNPDEQELENYISYNSIIAIGISLISNEFELLKKSKNKIVFFIENLGLFREGLSIHYKNIHFVEQLFSDYIKQFIKISFSPEPIYIVDPNSIFINRESEINKIIQAISSNEFRGLKILGIPGIGKKALVKELRTRRIINENCFEFYFQDEMDNLDDIISGLFSKLGIDSNIGNDEKYELRDKQTITLLTKFFNVFDGINGGSIIFFDLHKINYPSDQSRTNSEILEFFRLLINRHTYKGNKIIFVSDANFHLDIETELRLLELTIGGLIQIHIKELIFNEFMKRNFERFAKRILEIEDEDLLNIVGGHPQISKLFVKVAENYGVDNLVYDPVLVKQFNEKHKVDYLLSKIDISEDEFSTLEIVSLFNDYFEYDFVKELEIHLSHTLESLIDKFLVEKISFEDGTLKYYVPSLVKEVIKSKSSLEILKRNHDKIGNYYWSIGENLSQNSFNILDAYRKSLFHYTESENSEKIGLLSIRFKEKIIEKAFILAKKRHFEASWNLFNELYKVGTLHRPAHLIKYLELEIIIDRSNEETFAKLSKALQDYPLIEDFKIVLAKYLFSTGDYIGAKKVCEEIIGSNFPTRNNKLNLLYPKVLSKCGSKELAFKVLEKLINYLETKLKTNPSYKFSLNASFLLMIEFEINELIDYKSVVKNCILNLDNLGIGNSKLLTILESENVYSESIISKYELIHRHGIKYFESFIRYLERKGREHQINSMVEETKQDDFKIEKHKIQEFEINKQRERSLRNDDLLFYVKNKMGKTLNLVFKSKEEVTSYLSNYSNKLMLLLTVCEKIDALKCERSDSSVFDYIGILERLEITINLEKIISLSSDAVAQERYLESIENNVIYVEGETDEIYLRKAARILEKNHLNIIIKWIGNFDERGNVQFTGDTALNQTFNYYKSNPDLLQQNGKIILLYDSDTNKEPINFKNIFVRRMDTNEENKIFKIGIENLLTIPSNFSLDRFYSISKKTDDYGGESIIKKLEKRNLCNWICNEESIVAQKHYFARFNSIFEAIEAILKSDTKLPNH
jgi:hypothetical protein